MEHCLGVICLLQMEHVCVVMFVFNLVARWCCLIVGGPGFCSMSPEMRSRAANQCGDTHDWQAKKVVDVSLPKKTRKRNKRGSPGDATAAAAVAAAAAATIDVAENS